MNMLTRLWCGTAVAGIGASLWAFWLTYDDMRDRAASEREIARACAGLVSGEDVMDLRGGMVRATAGRTVRKTDLADGAGGQCRVYRVPEPGTSDSLFTLRIRTSSDRQGVYVVGDELGTGARQPFDYDFDHGEQDPTRRADNPEGRPLGDGALGSYTDESVTVRADCGASGPGLLTVTASADYENVSTEDLERLASMARGAATRAADAVGCETRLPALPDRLDPPSRTLRTARAADGSCAWYARHLGRAGTDRALLPDRAQGVPTSPRAPEETCLLAVSPDRARAARDGGQEDAARFGDSATTHSPWWIRTASYFGTDARSVAHEGYRDGHHPLRPGTAGGHPSGVLWASSTCAGEPALHTMTISYTYDGVLAALRKPLFESYVTDITQRRGCTDVKLPAGEAYWD
jgi:hypothetical protein